MAFDRIEYLKRIGSFCDKYGKQPYQAKALKGGAFEGYNHYFVYDSVQAVLANRIMGRNITVTKEDISSRMPSPDLKGEENYYYVAISRDSIADQKTIDFARFVGGVGHINGDIVKRLPMDFKFEKDMYGDRAKESNFTYFINGPVVGMACRTAEDKGKTGIVEHLTYDGICAYLALAPEKELVENAEEIDKEIKREREYECDLANVSLSCYDAEYHQIHSKYTELLCVKSEIVSQAQEILKAEESMSEENKTAGTVDSTSSLCDAWLNISERLSREAREEEEQE